MLGVCISVHVNYTACAACCSYDVYIEQKIKVELEDDGIPGTALREISLLKELAHPNIVELKASEVTRSY